MTTPPYLSSQLRPRSGWVGLAFVAWIAVACGSVRLEARREQGPAPASTVSSGPEDAVEGDAAPVAVASSTPPAGETPSDGRVTLPSEFPAGTQSLEVKEVLHVLGRPIDGARYIGKITRGTRVAWQRIVEPDVEPEGSRKKRRKTPCPAWVEIEPRGYLCRTFLAPSSQPPSGQKQPVVKSGKLVPELYFKVTADETRVFETAEDVRADVPAKLLSTKVMVVGQGTLHVDGTAFQRTDHGLIESTALAMFWPSDFAGTPLSGTDPRSMPPVAWVFFERGARKPTLYADANTAAEKIRSATRREIVPVLEERDGFVRVTDGEWIERKYLRVLRLAPPPAGIGEKDQWLDVDLDEQILVAYEGTSPVFATLVSSGGRRNVTPPAMYRVRAKAATTPMAGDPSVPNRYEVSAVPWAIRFADGLFVHGVYWHDGFGGPRSHGCVNVSPKDAAFLYEWIEPVVPDGWSEVEVPAGEGALVRVRNQANPEPSAFDYSREEPWNYPKAE